MGRKWTEFDNSLALADEDTFLVFNTSVSAVQQITWLAVTSSLDVQIDAATSVVSVSLQEYTDSVVSAASVSLQDLFLTSASADSRYLTSTSAASTYITSASAQDLVDNAPYLTSASAAATYLTSASAASSYLTSASAASSYLTSASAASSYITSASAASSYITSASVASSYLTSASAASSYLTSASAASSYLTSASAASTFITSASAQGLVTNAVVSVVGTSTSGMIYIPSGTTAGRPASPLYTGLRYNTAAGSFEGWDEAAWGAIGGGGGSVDIGQHVFYATRSATQTPSQNVWTKIQLSTETLDASNYFDPTTNYRYTPAVAGYYFFFGGCSANSADGSASGAAVYKNGSGVVFATQFAGSASAPNSSLVTLVHMNGSTDYVELFGYSSNASPSITSSFFGGFLVLAD